MSVAPAFDRWLEQFFDFYYRRHPVDATFIGIHQYDHVLPDFSPEANRQASADMRALRQSLAELPPEQLSEAQSHDRALTDGFLEIQLWENDSAHFHLGNPSLYTGEAVFSIMSLFHRDSEPVAERAEAATARMSAIPAFLDRSRKNLTAAPLVWTERAIREAKSGIAYFGRGVRLLSQERGIASPSFDKAADAARGAFETHLEWLERELSSRANDRYSAGREAIDRYLSRGHQLPPDRDSRWVEDYARMELSNRQARLNAQARELDPTKTAGELLGSLAAIHSSFEDYYPSYSLIWQEAKDAALSADLVTWPDFPIEYVPFPESDREAATGLYYLFYRCPAPFGRRETHKYRVTPIESSMPTEEQDRRLRATNTSVIKLNHVVHHGGLGHHVQNWNAFRANSKIGRVAGVDGASRIAMFCGGTLVEGWACYATDLMDEIGFLTPLESLSEQQSRVRMAARAVADVAIHVGSMTLDEAAAFYEREAGMPPAAAKGEAVKNSMFPGAAMMYLIGTDAIHGLRAKMKEREGNSFSLKRFHDRFLSYGAIPVSMISESMLAVPD